MTMKKWLLGGSAVLVVLVIGLTFWARSIFAQDTVRTAVAARLTQALGQPVTIGGIGAGIYPRVTVTLTDVGIGQPAAVSVGTMAIGTDFTALLSRRIEHGSMRLSGARITLPLPQFAIASRTQAPDATSPVEIGSIDEIALSGVEIVSGGRTLHGDIDVVPQGQGLDVRKIALKADDTAVNISGRIADMAGPSGELAVKARAVDLNRLLAFIAAFSKGIGGSGSTQRAAAPATRSGGADLPSNMDLTVRIDADRASMGALQVQKLAGTAKITGAGMTLDPVRFEIFGGRYEGALTLNVGDTPDFRLKATLSGIDMAAAMTFAGSPNTITGRMSGSVDVAGRGMDATAVSRSARGAMRVAITDGIVKNLGLIQAVVVATSMRTGPLDSLKGSTKSRDEPFSRLGGTMTIGGGEATTRDLRLESKDVDLLVTGSVRLDGSAVDLKGVARLSDALSQQAGRDLVRYTQEEGRVTLPATISGSAANPQVRIDVADVATRAVRNRATEEAQKAVKKGLSRMFGKR